MASRRIGWILGLLLIVGAAVLITETDSDIPAWFESQGIAKNPLEHPLIAVVLWLLG